MKIALIGYGNWGKKIFINLKKNFQFKDLISLKIKLKLNDFIITLICLSVPLMLYLFYNKIYFGYSLPTSFYVKSNISFSKLMIESFFLCNDSNI